MANTNAGGNLHKVVIGGGLGKSTLVTNPGLSIPMPRGSTPPPAPSGQESGQSGSQSGSSSGSQGTKTSG
jgi:hypothetical protein